MVRMTSADAPAAELPGPGNFNSHTGCVGHATELAPGLFEVGADVVGTALGSGLFDTDSGQRA
jgi:hypothetical protein